MTELDNQKTSTSIAERVKVLREASGMSLQAVADRVGCSKAHIWEMETGKALNPGVELLRAIGRCFGVTVAFLIGEDGAPEPQLLQLHPRAIAIAFEVDKAIREAAHA